MAWHAYQADLFDHFGLDVEEMPGARTRGSQRFGGLGDVWHATVTPPSVPDWRVAELLRDGRPDLNGPLSQRGTARTGTVWVVAAGRCNHNGYGYGGNDWFGNEFFNDGYGELLTAEQMRSGLIQSFALAQYNRWARDQVLGHKETDPNRKIDPRTVWMPAVRADVQHLLDTGLISGDFVMDAEAKEAFRKLNERLDRTDVLVGEMYQDVRGTHIPDLGDQNPRARAISTLTRGLSAELVGGSESNPNSRKSILRRIYRNNEVPVEPPPGG
jgi:hypothetical protein